MCPDSRARASEPDKVSPEPAEAHSAEAHDVQVFNSQVTSRLDAAPCGLSPGGIQPAPAIPNSRMNILYLFSGPASRHDSLSRFAGLWGKRLGVNFQVEEYDILNGSHQDLSDDQLFRDLLNRVRANAFFSIFMSSSLFNLWLSSF